MVATIAANARFIRIPRRVDARSSAYFHYVGPTLRTSDSTAVDFPGRCQTALCRLSGGRLRIQGERDAAVATPVTNHGKEVAMTTRADGMRRIARANAAVATASVAGVVGLTVAIAQHGTHHAAASTPTAATTATQTSATQTSATQTSATQTSATSSPTVTTSSAASTTNSSSDDSTATVTATSQATTQHAVTSGS